MSDATFRASLGKLGEGLEQAARAAVQELRTAADLVRWGASRFGEAGLCFGHGTDNAADEAVVLVRHALHLDADAPEGLLSGALTKGERREVVAFLVRRIRERIPAPYLTHEAWFSGLRFYVDERVLIPRSPLAEWIERGFEPWLIPERVQRVLDLGTGSGCLAVACAVSFPGARVDAVDVSPDALEVARRNIREHGLQDRVQAMGSDLFSGITGAYDLIVSNPPYVDAEVLATLPPEYGHEPRAALAAGEDGLGCVRRILTEAAAHLTPEGVLVVEVGVSRAALEDTFPSLPFVWLELQRGGENVFLLTAQELLRAAPGRSPH